MSLLACTWFTNGKVFPNISIWYFTMKIIRYSFIIAVNWGAVWPLLLFVQYLFAVCSLWWSSSSSSRSHFFLHRPEPGCPSPIPAGACGCVLRVAQLMSSSPSSPHYHPTTPSLHRPIARPFNRVLVPGLINSARSFTQYNKILTH